MFPECFSHEGGCKVVGEWWNSTLQIPRTEEASGAMESVEQDMIGILYTGK